MIPKVLQTPSAGESPYHPPRFAGGQESCRKKLPLLFYWVDVQAVSSARAMQASICSHKTRALQRLGAEMHVPCWLQV